MSSKVVIPFNFNPASIQNTTLNPNYSYTCPSGKYALVNVHNFYGWLKLNNKYIACRHDQANTFQSISFSSAVSTAERTVTTFPGNGFVKISFSLTENAGSPGQIRNHFLKLYQIENKTAASVSTPSTTIVLPNVEDLYIGMTITGSGIPSPCTITAINSVTNTITISNATTASGTSVALQFKKEIKTYGPISQSQNASFNIQFTSFVKTGYLLTHQRTGVAELAASLTVTCTHELSPLAPLSFWIKSGDVLSVEDPYSENQNVSTHNAAAMLNIEEFNNIS